MSGQIDQMTGLALQHHQSGRLTEARRLYLKILNQEPNHPIAPHMLGLMALAQGENLDAIKYFEQAVVANANNGDAHGNRGLALSALERLDEAVNAFQAAIAIDPADDVSLFNLGLTCSDLGRLGDAQMAYEQVLSINPSHVKALNNLGNVLWDRGHLDEADARYAKAIAIDPNNAEVHKTRGFLQLLRGNFEAGWANYAWRLKEPDCPIGSLNYPEPQWNGEGLSGKTILVYHEQGLGDVIQFARYLPLLRERGARVLFEVQAPLFAVMAESKLAEETFKAGETPLPFDYHIPLLELPRVMGTTLETIPGETPYLKAPASHSKEWQSRFSGDKGLKVGLVWTGNPVVASNPKRSINPQLLRSLGEVPGVSLYSLQVGRDGEAARVFDYRITDLSPLLKDYADTAAAMEQLDLVISTCTSPIHMAGALGRPCWALLSKWPDWRWLLNRSDSPWYPTMRLYRQETAGDWSGVIAEVKSALGEKVSRSSG